MSMEVKNMKRILREIVDVFNAGRSTLIRSLSKEHSARIAEKITIYKSLTVKFSLPHSGNV